MEKQEAIDCFIASAESVEEDLKQWEEEGLPSEKEIQSEWQYFLDLLQLANEEEIDKDGLVSQHARNCMAAFIELVPNLAQVTT